MDMLCPECKKNNWKLVYEGDSDSNNCDATENVSTYIGVYGRVKGKCECGYKINISVGSD